MWMKKIFIFIFSAVTLLGAIKSGAQTFTKQKDTATYTYIGTGAQSIFDKISVPASGSPVTLKWNIISCNFPSDWLASGSPGMCDNNLCYNFTGTGGLWPSGSSHFSTPYTPGATNGDFHMLINLGLPSITSSGTYYATVRLVNSAGMDSTTATFAITYNVPNEVPAVHSNEDVTLYPNPAISEVNLVYDANAEIKTIAVYNIIGKPMAAFRVSGNSANLNLENIPAGIYFARLVNAQGEVVVTRKFTKQ